MITKFITLPSGIKAAYRQVPEEPNPGNPTLVLLHSFATTLELYEPQFNDQDLTNKVNLLAVDELGHGRTEGPTGWSYWTTAQMVLDLTDALNIPKVYALGTSQGGFIVARMAILRPDKLLGIVPTGSSMYAETDEMHKLGSWNAREVFSPWYKSFVSEKPTPDFEVPAPLIHDLVYVGFGETATKEQHEFWTRSVRGTYKGEAGRKKILMSTVCLEQRDSLEYRLPEILCPVLILHGTKDAVYSVAMAEKYSQQIKNSRSVELKVIEGGHHFLSASHPKETGKFVLDWILKWEGKP